MCCEPLLEPVQLDLRGISWVIVAARADRVRATCRQSGRATCAISAVRLG